MSSELNRPPQQQQQNEPKTVNNLKKYFYFYSDITKYCIILNGLQQQQQQQQHETPESEFSNFECYQNYTAPEVFVQHIAGIVNQGDVEVIVRAQKQM